MSWTFAEPGALSSSSSLPEVQIPAGARLSVFASNEAHGVHSPTALSQRDDGAWLVAETHRFMEGGGIDDNRRRRHWLLEDLAAQNTADRLAMYERWYHRHPAEQYTTHSEKIRYLADRSGDGQADHSQLFAEGFNQPLDGTAAGIMSLGSKTYFACIPHLWLLQDADGDGVSETRQSLQEGFGVRVSFSGHDLNGFALGPDGRLYATIGDRGFSLTTAEGRRYHYPDQGAILRFDLDGSNFEVVHTGLRNPKEIAFDSWGQGITVDNNSDQRDRARIVDVVDGADSGWRMGHQVMHSFHREIGLSKRPPNVWMAEQRWKPENPAQPAWLLPPLANFTHGPSGLAFHPSHEGSAASGRFFICDYRGSRAQSRLSYFTVEPDNAGFKLGETGDLVLGAAVTDVDFGHDGQLYLSDFLGGWSSHGAGRILRLDWGRSPKGDELSTLFRSGIENLPSEQLSLLLGHNDQRVRLRAQVALAGRPDGFAAFVQACQSGRPILERLHGTWGLWLLARRESHPGASEQLARLLGDGDARIRAQAARAYGEAHAAQASALLPLLNDPAPRVVFLTAQSLARLADPASVSPLLEAADEWTLPGGSPHLRHAFSRALAHCATEELLAELSESSSATQRLLAVIALRQLKSPRLVDFLQDPQARIADEAIRSVHELQLEGTLDPLARLIDPLSRPDARPLTPLLQRRLVQSAYRSGSVSNAKRLAKVAASPHWDLGSRAEALRLLGQWEEPFPIDQLLGRHAPLEKRDLEEIRASLEQELEPMLKTDGPLLAATLNLVDDYQLQLQGLTAERLFDYASNPDLEASVRAQALRNWAATQEGRDAAGLEAFLFDPEDDAAITALQSLARSDPDEAARSAIEFTRNRRSQAVRRQAAWKILGHVQTPAAREHLLRSLQDASQPQGAPDPTSALEMVEAARQSEDPAVTQALARYESHLVASDALGKWLLSLDGGDATRGQSLFESHGAAQCQRCHAIGPSHETKVSAGPNLAGIARRSEPRYLLESLIQPSAQLSPGYGHTSLFFENGGFLAGTLIQRSEDRWLIRSGSQLWEVDASDIDKPSPPVSSMPAMGQLLSPYEVRDLVAYLGTLDGPALPRPQMAEARPFSPALAQRSPLALGALVYQNTCAACHGETGQGLAPTPPLAGSEWLQLEDAQLVRMQLNGLSGPIRVKGRHYQGAMPANAHLSDVEVAAVVTYLRSRFGSEPAECPPELVTSLRRESRQRPWSAEELLALSRPELRQRIQSGPQRPAASQLIAPREPKELAPQARGAFPLLAGLWALLSLAGAFIRLKEV